MTAIAPRRKAPRCKSPNLPPIKPITAKEARNMVKKKHDYKVPRSISMHLIYEKIRLSDSTICYFTRDFVGVRQKYARALYNQYINFGYAEIRLNKNNTYKLYNSTRKWVDQLISMGYKVFLCGDSKLTHTIGEPRFNIHVRW